MAAASAMAAWAFAMSMTAASMTGPRNPPRSAEKRYVLRTFVRTDGGTISDSTDCNTCHTIVGQQVAGKAAQVSLAGLPYVHPVDVGADWKTGPCADCHNTPPEAKAAEKPKVVGARTP